MATGTIAPSAGAETSTGTAAASPTAGSAPLTDDQILGIGDASAAESSRAEAPGSQDGDGADQTASPDGADENSDFRANENSPNDPFAQNPAKPITPEMREFFKTHPEVRDAWYRAQEFSKLFPDFKTAELVASQIAQYENANELADDLKGVADLKAIDRMFYSGDPTQHAQIVENLFRDNPDAFAMLLDSLPDTLARMAADGSRPDLAQRARQLSSETGARNFERMLDSSYRKAKAEGNGALAQKIEEVATALLGRSPWGQESVEAKMAQLRQVEQQLAERQRQTQAEAVERWVGEANEQVVRDFTGAVEQSVEQLVGNAYSGEAKRLLIGEIYRRVNDSLEKNSDLVGHVQALLRGGAGDPKVQRQVVRLVSTQAKRMIPGVAEKVIGAFGQASLAATEQRQRRNAAAAGRVDVTGASAIDARGGKTPTASELRRTGKYGRLSDDDILDGRM